MASTYGANFGFRRSDEHLRSGNEGRFRLPKTGPVIRQGSLVTIDTANPGYVKVADANAVLEPGFTGVLVQEEGHLVRTAPGIQDKGLTVQGQLCSIWTGAGLVIWVKNAEDREVVAADLAVGDQVAWDGSKFVETSGTGAIGRVVTAGTGYAEISLNA